MSRFQMTVVLEIPDNKPEFPDSLVFCQRLRWKKWARTC